MTRYRIAAALALLALACAASAQEMPTKKQSASLQLFGLFSYVQPHYDPSNNLGGSFGAELNLRPLDFLQPSLDLRATFGPGSDVSETTYDAGPRLEAEFGRFRPYVVALIGTGKLTFQHPVIFPTGPYTHDSSTIFSGGLGADYLLTHSISIRGEVMVQRWNLGDSPTTSVIFHPRIFSVGVDYRFDFNTLHRHR